MSSPSSHSRAGPLGNGPFNDTALTLMLNMLHQDYLYDLPAPCIAVIRLAARPPNAANWYETGYSCPFGLLSSLENCLQALVRFQFWANELEQVDAAVATLHQRLFAARHNLCAIGFVHVSLQGTTLAERARVPKTWRKATYYKILCAFYA